MYYHIKASSILFSKSPVLSEDPGETDSFYEIDEDCLYLNIWKYNDNIKNNR